MNYSGVIVQGRSLLSLVVKGIPWGQLTRASCSVGNYSGKDVLGGIAQGGISWEHCPERKLFRGNYLWGKGGNCPGENFTGGNCLGGIIQW